MALYNYNLKQMSGRINNLEEQIANLSSGGGGSNIDTIDSDMFIFIDMDELSFYYNPIPVPSEHYLVKHFLTLDEAFRWIETQVFVNRGKATIFFNTPQILKWTDEQKRILESGDIFEAWNNDSMYSFHNVDILLKDDTYNSAPISLENYDDAGEWTIISTSNSQLYIDAIKFDAKDSGYAYNSCRLVEASHQSFVVLNNCILYNTMSTLAAYRGSIMHIHWTFIYGSVGENIYITSDTLSKILFEYGKFTEGAYFIADEASEILFNQTTLGGVIMSLSGAGFNPAINNFGPDFSCISDNPVSLYN